MDEELGIDLLGGVGGDAEFEDVATFVADGVFGAGVVVFVFAGAGDESIGGVDVVDEVEMVEG